MKQDPITTRFLEVFNCLKDTGKVRSARQFAIAIGTYPQSFNDIKKGRREATLLMIQKLVEIYDVNAHYILTGQGSQELANKKEINSSPSSEITFIQAHQFTAYAQAVLLNEIDVVNWTKWYIPSELIGQEVELAFQCNTDRLSSCLNKGDVLFARRVPRNSWKSNLSSKRVYVIVLEQNLHILRIKDLDVNGLTIKVDDRNIPSFIAFQDIKEIWSPTSKWSHQVVSKLADQPSASNIDSALEQQNEAIQSLSLTITKWMSQNRLEPQF